MVLGGQPPGRVGRRRFFIEGSSERVTLPYYIDRLHRPAGGSTFCRRVSTFCPELRTLLGPDAWSGASPSGRRRSRWHRTRCQSVKLSLILGGRRAEAKSELSVEQAVWPALSRRRLTVSERRLTVSENGCASGGALSPDSTTLVLRTGVAPVRRRPSWQGFARVTESGPGYSSPYSPRVANSIIRSRASADFAESFFICTNIGSYSTPPSGHEHVFAGCVAE